MTSRHTYLKTHRLRGELLVSDLAGQAAALRAKAATAPARRAAKTLVKEDDLRVTLISLQRGTELSAHQADGAVTVQALRGRATAHAGGRAVELRPGRLVAVAARVPHAITARTDCDLLLTVAM
jgi:quercetin dioxygenase-like cupin family protein